MSKFIPRVLQNYSIYSCLASWWVESALLGLQDLCWSKLHRAGLSTQSKLIKRIALMGLGWYFSCSISCFVDTYLRSWLSMAMLAYM